MPATAEERNDTLLTVGEVAARLRVSTDAVYDLYRCGRLAGVKLGRRVSIFADSVQAILDEGRRRAKS